MMRRHGITLTETIVALSIIAVVLAIACPAIVMARAAARRIHCQSNLRQVMLAVQNHHGDHQKLPSFYNGKTAEFPLNEWDLFHQHSWRVPLLPYLEQKALHQQIDFGDLATSRANTAVAQTAVPVFLCPSGGDPNVMGWGLRHESFGLNPVARPARDRYWVVRSDFDAMAGIQKLPETLPKGVQPDEVEFVHWGVWGWPEFENGSISGSNLIGYRQGEFRDIRDGLSNTLAIVERAGKPTQYLRGRPHRTKENPDAVYPGQVGWSASNTFAWSLHRDRVGVNESNVTGIYSFHSGGANVAIADGSVRFLSDTTDFETLVSLFGRSDGGIPTLAR